MAQWWNTPEPKAECWRSGQMRSFCKRCQSLAKVQTTRSINSLPSSAWNCFFTSQMVFAVFCQNKRGEISFFIFACHRERATTATLKFLQSHEQLSRSMSAWVFPKWACELRNKRRERGDDLNNARGRVIGCHEMKCVLLHHPPTYLQVSQLQLPSMSILSVFGWIHN